MNGFAPLLAAIVLAQEPAAAPSAAETPGAAATPVPVDAPPPRAHPATTVPASVESAAPDRNAAQTPTPDRAPLTTRPPPPAKPASARPAATPVRARPPTPAPTPAVRSTPAAPAAAALPAAAASPASTATSERGDAEGVARQFVAALVRGDADALTQLGAERFSFDGDAQSGREAVRRTWRALLAGRAAPPPALGRIEVLSIADAVARHGKPPARLEPLARPGSLVAIADVGGRTIVLFLAREGTRLAVTGMHD